MTSHWDGGVKTEIWAIVIRPKESTKQRKAIYEQDGLYKKEGNLVFDKNKSTLKQIRTKQRKRKQPLRDQNIGSTRSEEYYDWWHEGYIYKGQQKSADLLKRQSSD